MTGADTGFDSGAAQPKLPPAYRLVVLDSVASTNDEAKRLAEQGAEDGTLVWAREQTKGRGRRGRDWVSPRGNLYLSLILRPDCSLAQAAQLGFVAALGIGEALGSVGPPRMEVTYKWPNDVLLMKQKVAGILLESKTSNDGGLAWLVLGLGVNVANFPEDTQFPATCLRNESGASTVSEVDVLETFSRHFLAWVNRWLEDGFLPIRNAWLSHAEGLGEKITVNLPRESLSGTFKGLDESGALILTLADGKQRKITAGDVYFDPAEPPVDPS